METMEMTPTVAHSTFVIERSYATTPQRVFAAFADAEKRRRWFAEGEGSDLVTYKTDFRVGGQEVTSRSSRGPVGPFPPGTCFTNHTTYLDIVPEKRIVFGYTMSLNDNRFSASLATIELVVTDTGTDLIFTDQGAYFENSDGAEMRKGGWSKLLDRLGKELED